MAKRCVLLVGALLVVGGASPASGVLLGARATSSDLQTALTCLNNTVGGRLYNATPWELPCFSTYDGSNVTQNASECALIQHNYTVPTTRVTYFGAYMLPQWETCQSSAVPEGCLLDSSNTSDPLAFENVNCQIGNIPPLYIDVREVSDVQAALHFSDVTGVRLSVKNKGHDYKGRSSGKDTLSLWVTNLNSISYDGAFVPNGCSSTSTYDAITVGPGALTEDIYAFVDSINRTVVGGYHQTIGFGGGYFLGGGHSILTPVYGLAVDNVQVKVVTPDGEYRTANECQNQDLFWALRGGGGSAFGVVIESSHTVVPQVTLQVASISFISTSNISSLAGWYDLLINNTYELSSMGWGGHIVSASIVYVNPLISLDEATASMQPLVDYAIANGGTAVIETLPSWYAFFSKYVTLAQAGVGPELTLGTRLLTTDLFNTTEGRATLSSVVNDVLSFASPYVVVGTPFLYNYTEGTTSVTPAWRNSLWHLSLKGVVSFNSTLEQRTEMYATVSEHVNAFRAITPDSGAYFNEGDVYEPNHTDSYWGDNYPRLLSIKQQYDPQGLLDCWQCVGWNGETDPLYQCHIKLNDTVATTTLY
ncbi:FAD-binding domain-containing protein [Sparassis latifolia]